MAEFIALPAGCCWKVKLIAGADPGFHRADTSAQGRAKTYCLTISRKNYLKMTKFQPRTRPLDPLLNLDYEFLVFILP